MSGATGRVGHTLPPDGPDPSGTTTIATHRTTLTVEADLDLARTVLVARMGAADPCWRTGPDGTVSWAQHTAAGPATVALTPAEAGTVAVEAWGPGAEVAAGAVPGVLGYADETPTSDDPVLTDLIARFPGFRLTATGRVVDAAVAAVCTRGVSAFEGDRAWSLAVERLGDEAPGPGGLRLPPLPRRLAAADPYDLHVLGLEHDRADEVRRVASHAARLDGAPAADVLGRLGSISGLGTDVADHVRNLAFGVADAVPVVDPHLTAIVVELVGPPGADRGDLRAALDAHRPQRGRLVRLVELAGERPTP